MVAGEEKPESPRTAAEIWTQSLIETLQARVNRLESVLETTRALSDQRAVELVQLRGELEVLRKYKPTKDHSGTMSFSMGTPPSEF
jgi:hypothetical protein